MEPIRRSRAAEILEAFPRHRLVVFGDFMLDRYVLGEASRISPEAPIPILRFRKEDTRAGGAANVVKNLVALGASAVPVGIVGADPEAERLRFCLEQEGVPLDGLLEVEGRMTTVKTRFLAGHHPVARVDREDDRPVPDSVARDLLRLFRESLPGASGIIVSDYEKGVLTEATCSALMAEARARGLPVFVDPKTSHFSRFHGAALLTPNLAEARTSAGWSRPRAERDLDGLGGVLLGSIGCRGLLVTLGEEGMVLFEPGRPPVRIPASAREVFDVTGAGDTVIAVAALGVLAGATLLEASLLSNRAAGEVVGRVGTATLTREDILDLFP